MLLIATTSQLAAASRDWFDTVVGVASALNTLVLLALVLVLVPAVWSFTQSLRQLRALLDRVYDDLKPLTNHANRIAANVDEITDSVRTEVTHVVQSVAKANEGISRAIASTERRLQQFGALADVAQEEVERAFVSTAAVVEGVKAGAKAATRADKSEDHRADETDDVRPAHPRVRARRKRRD
jgi:uncharacterized protein YoxC